jgi:hypothetical protein
MTQGKYKVGYKKPPKHTRFKVGNREHLKRRKKGDRLVEGKILRQVLQTRVDYWDGGKLKRGTRLEVQIKSIGTAALKGDVGAADQLLKMRQCAVAFGDLNPTVVVISGVDAQL